MESECEVIRCGNMYLVPGQVTEAPALATFLSLHDSSRDRMASCITMPGHCQPLSALHPLDLDLRSAGAGDLIQFIQIPHFTARPPLIVFSPLAVIFMIQLQGVTREN